MPRAPVLSGFRSTPAAYRVEQARCLTWLRDAHVEAQARMKGLDAAARDAFADRLGRVIARCACGPDKIGHRGISFDPEAEVLGADVHGADSLARTRRFAELVDAYFARGYADDAAPDDLIHVTALLWRAGHTDVLAVQLGLVTAFGVYQVVYWNVVRPRDAHAATSTATANNEFFGERDAAWYDAEDTPLALLRAESRHRNPWIAGVLARELGPGPHAVLDLGCGAGYLANALAARGHHVTGVDLGSEALAVAHRHDPTGSVDYRVADALALPFADASFDVVCAMDLIEHVEEPARLVAEAGRVLRPGGLLFFHTFNRTWQAHLVVIKGVEWFVRNTPAHLHVQRLFVTPGELDGMCRAHALAPVEVKGSRPRFGWPLWRMIVTGRVGDDFAFTFTPSTKLGYTGYARKAA